MGPRPFSRGRVVISVASRVAHQGFNGATAFQPWKDMDLGKVAEYAERLQWGHGLSAVEGALD